MTRDAICPAVQPRAWSHGGTVGGLPMTRAAPKACLRTTYDYDRKQSPEIALNVKSFTTYGFLRVTTTPFACLLSLHTCSYGRTSVSCGYLQSNRPHHPVCCELRVQYM
eukprot:2062714-Prymnesium_polylepis.1